MQLQLGSLRKKPRSMAQLGCASLACSLAVSGSSAEASIVQLNHRNYDMQTATHLA
jgi:hypothetical protein